jgi:serine protease Do
METPPAPSSRHSPQYIAVLALAAVAILAVGSLLRPRKPPSEAVPPLSPTETQRLLRMAQRQTLETMTEHFALVAGDVAPRVVQLGAAGDSGVVWSADLVVTSARGGRVPESSEVTTAAGQSLPASRAVSGPQLPLAAYRVSGLPEPPAPRAAGTLPRPGEWVLAVWRRNGDDAFAPGHYLEADLTSCGEHPAEEVLSSLSFSAEMAGGGLFDLDGSLRALILRCGERYAALTLDSVSRLLAYGRTFEGQLLARHGLRVAAMDEETRRHLRVVGGALVTEVWSGYPAAAAGLRPGDVIQELDASPVGSPDDLQPLVLTAPEPRWALVARRGGRTIEVTLDAAPGEPSAGPEDGEGSGVRLEPPADGFPIGSVVPGSRGDEVGIRPGDRVVRMDQAVPRSAAEVRRALAGGGPVFLELERGQRRLGVLLDSR